MTPATLHLPPDATAAHAGPNVVSISALADAAQPHITAHRLRWESENRFRWYHALVLGGFIAVMFFALTVLT